MIPLLLLLSIGTAAPILVVEPKVGDGLSKAEASLLADAFINEARATTDRTFIAANDIAARLDVDAQRRLVGCDDDTSCFIEIADALGADEILSMQVGRVGASYVVSVSLLDRKTIRTNSRAQITTKGESADVVLPKIPELVRNLFGTPVAAAPAVNWLWLAPGLGAIAAGGSIIALTELVYVQPKKEQFRIKAPTQKEFDDAALTGLALEIGGGALIAVGTIACVIGLIPLLAE